MTPISTIASFFQTAFQNIFTSLLQPAYITIASIFLLLNFIFIYPDLIANNVTYIIYLGAINPIFQVMLLTVVALILGYLFMSLNSYFLGFLTGELWYKSYFGRWLIKLRKHDKKHLDDLQTNPKYKKIQALGLDKAIGLEVSTHFPQNEDDITSPTSLGNVMNATADYVSRHYGIEMAALWSHMNIVLADAANASSSGTDNAATALKKLIDNNKATLDFLVTLAVVLDLFAIETILVQFCWLHNNVTVLWEPFVFFFVGYIVYKAAVAQARSWGDSVEMAFDMYRNQLASHLGLKPFNSVKDEHEAWKEVSDWLLRDIQEVSVFAGIPPYPPPPSNITVNSSANVKVTSIPTVITKEVPEKTEFYDEQRALQGFQNTLQSTSYVLIVDNIETNNRAAKGIHILIADTQVLRISSLPNTRFPKNAIPLSGEIISANSISDVDKLLWHINTLPTDGSASFDYTLPSIVVQAWVEPKTLELEDFQISLYDTMESYKLTIHNKTSQEVDTASITVFDSRLLASNFPYNPTEIELKPAQEGRPKVSQDKDTYCLEIGKIAAHTSITLTYSIPNQRKKSDR